MKVCGGFIWARGLSCSFLVGVNLPHQRSAGPHRTPAQEARTEVTQSATPASLQCKSDAAQSGPRASRAPKCHRAISVG